ncbi:MAG TPA: SET domain-containing protein [bacterium]|nr:SET domain-containing protein [bacterium]
MRIKPWVSEAVEVRKSGMEGQGVYAVQNIKENDVIGVFGGIVIPEGEIEVLSKTVPADKLNLDHAMYIYPGFIMLHDYENGCDPLCFVNHACDPSSKVVNGIVLVANRDIPKGEEISWDYRQTDNVGNWTYEFKCQCGSANCTGAVQVGPKYRTKVTAASN